MAEGHDFLVWLISPSLIFDLISSLSSGFDLSFIPILFYEKTLL